MKTKTVRLGSLGLMETFKFPDEPTLYRTITYPPSNVNHSMGYRWCLNLTDNTAISFACSKKVFHESQKNEFSEVIES